MRFFYLLLALAGLVVALALALASTPANPTPPAQKASVVSAEVVGTGAPVARSSARAANASTAEAAWNCTALVIAGNFTGRLYVYYNGTPVCIVVPLKNVVIQPARNYVEMPSINASTPGNSPRAEAAERAWSLENATAEALAVVAFALLAWSLRPLSCKGRSCVLERLSSLLTASVASLVGSASLTLLAGPVGLLAALPGVVGLLRYINARRALRAWASSALT